MSSYASFTKWIHFKFKQRHPFISDKIVNIELPIIISADIKEHISFFPAFWMIDTQPKLIKMTHSDPRQNRSWTEMDSSADQSVSRFIKPT